MSLKLISEALLCLCLSVTNTDFYAEAIPYITLYKHPLTWNDANFYCESINESLVTIDTGTKFDEIGIKRSLYYPDISTFWIGLHSPYSNNPASRNWTKDCSVSGYEIWSNTASTGECTYANAASMVWSLAICDADTLPFMCERDTTIYNYQVIVGRLPKANIKTTLVFVSVAQCKTKCDTIAATSICWGFVYGLSSCGLYDDSSSKLNPDEYSNVTGSSLYIRKCELNMTIVSSSLTVPSYDTCGRTVVSRCSACVTTVGTTTFTTKVSTMIATNTQNSLQSTTGTYTATQKTTEILTMPSTNTQDAPVLTECSTLDSAESSTTKESTDSSSKTDFTESSTSQDTTESPYTTENTSKSLTSKDELPYCLCTCTNETTNLTLEEYVKQIVDNIKIDKTKTSSSIRKLTSASDPRPSSAAIGIIGLILIIAVFAFLSFLDFYSLIEKFIVIIRKRLK